MPRCPYLSFPLWVALVLLLWTIGAAASVAFGADQKPLVKNPTTGVIEAIQPGNNLVVPNGYIQASSTVTTGGVSFLNGTTSAGDGMTLRYTETAQGVIPADTWQFRMGGSTARPVAFTNFDAINLLNITPAGVVSLPVTSGSNFLVASTTSSTTKDTGSVILEGGIGIEENVSLGGQVRIINAATTGQPVFITMTTSGSDSLQMKYTEASVGSVPADVWQLRFGGSSPRPLVLTNGDGVLWATVAVTGAITSHPTTGTMLTVSSTQASTTKDNGAVVLEGGMGLEGAMNAGASSSIAGNLTLTTAGNGLLVKEGTNAKMGVATLVGGTVTVNTTAVTANSRIFLTAQALGTVAVPSGYGVSARVASTSFTILASAPTDTSQVAWMIVEPAP